MTRVSSLQRVSEAGQSSVYPTDVLDGSHTALLLFGAGFLGVQDGHWIAAAGLHGTVVDTNPEPLKQMEGMYPSTWRFVCADAFSFTERTSQRWDVLSVDCPTSLFDRCAELVGRWCGLANRAVVLGTGESTTVVAPDGWTVTDTLKRSDFQGGVYWTVLEPVSRG